ncbi:MAG: ABC transporter ATP-binding protein [Lachnospira sp.]|nr:ABC transporter ATP-binding protein [Lachnospira sp.]
MGKLLKYIKKYWIQITLAAVSSVTASVSTVMIIDILKLIIDQIAGGTLKQTIHFIVIKMLIVICAGIVSNYMVVAMTGFVGAGLLQNLRNDAVNALMKASPEYINKCNYGDMMERITEDIEGLAGFMSGYFKDCLYVPVITIVYSVYLFLMNPPLAAICLMPLAICVGGVFVFRNVITIGVLIAYMSIIKKLIDPLSYTYQLVVRFQTALVSVSRVFEIIEIQPEKTDYEEKCVEKGGNLLISFENVSFAYEDENVLHNVSFRVKPDERIAFV